MVPLMVLVSGLNISSRGLKTSSSRSRNLAAGTGADLLAAAAGTCLGAMAVGRRADPASLVVRLICPPLPTLRVRLPICLLRTAAAPATGLPGMVPPVAAAKALLAENALLAETAAATASFFLVVSTVFPRVVVVMVMRPLAVFFTSS